MMTFELVSYGSLTELAFKGLKNKEMTNFFSVFIGTFPASAIEILLQLILIPILALRLKRRLRNN